MRPYFRLSGRALVRSRLGRRILLLFFSCALVPTVALASLAFREVSALLQEQSEDRLGRLSRSIGEAIRERLVRLESEFSSRAGGDAGDRGSSRGPDPTRPLTERVTAVGVLTRDGVVRSVIGEIGRPPPIDPPERRILRAGETSLIVDFGPRPPRVFLVRALDPGAPEGDLAFWQVRPDYLWSVPAVYHLEPGTEFCVLGPSLRPLHCSHRDDLVLPERIRERMHRSDLGYFEWRENGTLRLGSYANVSFGPTSSGARWILVAARDKPDLLSAAASFKRTFPVVVAGALLLVLVLSTSQIRRSLVPLERLQEGTRAISAGDFDARVEVASRDEFEELAASFNGMARRLGQQFRTLAAIAELDRTVLTDTEVESVVQTLLARLPDVHPCDVSAIVLTDPRGGAIARIHVAGDSGVLRTARCRLSSRELDDLRTMPGHLWLHGADELPAYLEPLAAEGGRSFLVLPIFHKSELLGMIALARKSRSEGTVEELVQVRRLADQMGVALSNVRMFEQVWLLAYTDPLTGLPNRAAFQDRISEALAEAEQTGGQFAVGVFDLDNFKRINETLGHAMGDVLLQAVGKRALETLQRDITTEADLQAARPPDVGRVGGGAFAVLLRRISDPQEAARAGERILDMFAQRFLLGSREVFATASVGIAVYPLDGRDADSLLKNADAALYHAKENGGNKVQFYRESMSAVALHRLNLEGKLRRALERGEFMLHYQPVVDLRTGAMGGVEALVRWRDPDSGMVAPAEFIALAEESAIIEELGRWVLREACAQVRRWNDDGLPRLRVAVNVSGRQFRDKGLLANVVQVLGDTGLDPGHLVLEVTESVLMERGLPGAVLDGLRAIGLGISLDDFGTGYSSLSYLMQFPIDSVKIDRSFVVDVHRTPSCAAIIQAIIALAHSLGLKVVAEGVESEEELAFLRAQGCDAIQGNLYSEPVPARKIARYLRTGRTLDG